MPNWCHNTLDVTGEPKQVADYVEHARTKPHKVETHDLDALKEDRKPGDPFPTKLVDAPLQPLTFENDVPEPDDVGEGWYEWRLANWGTKWDARFEEPWIGIGAADMDVEKTTEALGVQAVDGVAVYKFDTAWSPPLAWARASAAAHPEVTLTLRFAEVGGDFAGQVVFRAGELNEETELEVTDVLAPEEMWF